MVKLGRIFFAIPLGVFGIQYLVLANGEAAFPQSLPGQPAGTFLLMSPGLSCSRSV